MELVSLVVPCYNEEEVLLLFYEAFCELRAAHADVDFETVFVDDGSADGTLALLRGLHQKDARVRFVSFSRNFGKEAGLYAGLQAARGDYVAVLDADLQHPPEMIGNMLAAVRSGEYDSAAAFREKRQGEAASRGIFSRLFFKVMQRLTSTDMPQGATDFRLMNRKMVGAVLSLSEYNRFSKGIFGWVGFRTKWIPYESASRAAGETKWSLFKLMIYGLNGLVAFSTTPLIVSSIAGLLFCLIALVMIVVIVVKTLVWGDPVAGFPTLISVLFLVGGLNLFCIGILGQYLAKTYLETKRRPLYIVATTEEDMDNAEAPHHDG